MTIKVWEVAREAQTKRFAAHTAPVTCMAFCPGGRFFVSGSKDRSCILWDFACGFKMWEYHGHMGIINAVAAMPDGSGILTASGDHTARLWYREKSDEALRFGDTKGSGLVGNNGSMGHNGAVNGLSVSKDSQQLITVGDDNRAILWNLRTCGTPQLPLGFC